MRKLYTIGSNKKSLRKFAELLQSAGVDTIIDVRLNNTSQLAGFAKKDDLEYVLELLGIAYEHHPDLAPTDEILKAYRETKEFEAYEREFSKLIAERDMAAVGAQIFDRYSRPCLLCAEDTPEHCHRRLIAEEWARELPDVEIEHLI